MFEGIKEKPAWMIEYEKLDEEFQSLAIEVKKLINESTSTPETNRRITEIQKRQDVILSLQYEILTNKNKNKK